MAIHHEGLKPVYLKEGKLIGYLWKEYKETVSVINFVGIKSKPVISRGWRKSNLDGFEKTEYVNDCIPGRAEVCDHCEQHVTVLYSDSESWMFCPDCWPLYHLYEPKKRVIK